MTRLTLVWVRDRLIYRPYGCSKVECGTSAATFGFPAPRSFSNHQTFELRVSEGKDEP